MDVVAVFCFLLLTAGPLLWMAQPADNSAEKRVLSSMPTFEWSTDSFVSFPRQFESYVNDHFGLRNFFLDLNGRVSKAVFDVSGSKDVVVGKRGWLFYAGEGSLDDMLGRDPFPRESVDRWVLSIAQRAKWLETRGATYRMILAPDKHNIYSDLLPSSVRYAHRPRADEVRRQLAGSPYFLDLMPFLINARHDEGDALYFQTDTHWTSLGAYIAYQHIARSLGPVYAQSALKFSPSDFARRGPAVRRDLAGMARVGGSEADDTVRPDRVPRCQSANPGLPPLGLISGSDIRMTTFVCKSGHGSALVFHDSFMEALSPYLTTLFSRVTYVWARADDDIFVRMVAQVHPDVVIDERVERYMRSVPEAQLSATIDKLNNPSTRGFTTEAGNAQLLVNELLTRSGKVDTVNGKPLLKVAGREWGEIVGADSTGSGGNVENVSKTPAGYDVSGWAGLPASKSAADYLLVTSRGTVVLAVPVTYSRMDVASAFDAPRLANAGFRVTIPKELVLENSGDLHLYALHGRIASPLSDSKLSDELRRDLPPLPRRADGSSAASDPT